MPAETPVPDVYAPAADADRAPRAVYIHVPFCLHRCGYCDFTLVAQRDDLIPAYLTALQHELSMMQGVHEVDSIFIGGGTPSHLTPLQLRELIGVIRQKFRLTPDGEFSLEANPDGLDEARLAALSDCGVNRLSLGVQSFDDQILRTLERQHTAAEAIDVVVRAAEWFGNVSLDLIFGVPGQSLKTWQDSLTAATQLPLSHISTYGLTFEKGTDFFQRQRRGSLMAVPDEQERQMYDLGMSSLTDAGFEHYEISNFARPGSACRHNMVYWAAEEYYAFGPGAARYVNGIRSTNARSVTRWIRAWLDRRPALQEYEQLDAENRAREAVFLGLRLVRGLNLAQFEKRFGTAVDQLAGDSLRSHTAAGFLESVDGALRLTHEGRFIADTIVADFL